MTISQLNNFYLITKPILNLFQSFQLLIILLIFSYLQYVAVGPLKILLMSNDQVKIVKNERVRYDQSNLPKRPRFSVQLDATGSIIAPVKNCDERKRRYNYALVLPIRIIGDTTMHETIFSVADYVSNDHTAKSIHFFLSEISEKQPGIQGKNKHSYCVLIISRI